MTASTLQSKPASQAPYSIEFFIPGLPSTTNSLRRKGHWSKLSSEAKKWHEWVWLCCLEKGRPKSPLQKAKLTLTRFSSVSPDYDGLVSTFKPIIDGLVKSGVLVNDKFENIGAPDYKWEKCKLKEGKILVRVESV